LFVDTSQGLTQLTIEGFALIPRYALPLGSVLQLHAAGKSLTQLGASIAPLLYDH
jgi:hypothetical protein